jgi:hypothetical protein
MTTDTDTTQPTIALLRQLRRGRARRQATDAAYWIYLIVFVIVVYGSSVIADAVRALRRPPAATAATPYVLHALPAGLTALALLLLLVLLRTALWRGPVTLPQVTVDWLLGTPVSRGRLLRPRFWASAVLNTLVGAAVGLVPAAVLIALGLGHRSGALPLAGVAMLSTALLFLAATGAAVLVERHPAALRRATPVVVAAALALAGLATWAALGHAPAVIGTVVLWSGPWGWAAQGLTALASSAAPAWPVATALLAATAAATLAVGHQAAAGVPGPALRRRAATMSAMSAAMMSLDTRGLATAYGAAGQPRRARVTLPPPRRPELILFWRDLLALLRAPSRLAGSAALAVLAVGLLALAAHGPHVSLLAVACGVGLGYLAAAWLCEGARLDAEDARRSVHLPFQYRRLAWWHAGVPAALLLVFAGVPAVVIAIVAGQPRPLVLLIVAIPVLVTGAMVNVFRGQFPLDMFAGVDTPLGNTAAFKIIFWSVWGPLLAVGSVTLLVDHGLTATKGLTTVVVIGAGLTAGLGIYASSRASRLSGG